MKNGQIRRKRYSNEFKKKTVHELLLSKENVSTFSRKNGIGNSMVHRWLKKYRNEFEKEYELADNAFPEELVMLKKEIVSIKESIEVIKRILKKSFSCKYQILDCAAVENTEQVNQLYPQNTNMTPER